MVIFYVPVFFAILFLMMRHRSFNAALRANWALPKGGLFPGSKDDFHQLFPEKCPLLPRSEKLSRKLTTNEALKIYQAFGGKKLVLKPDDGIQGRAVQFLLSPGEFEKAWDKRADRPCDWLLQEFVEGFEAAAFYIRQSPDSPGRIVSMTWKQGFEVTGDGISTLEMLIARRPSDEATRKRIAKFNHAILADVPRKDEKVELMPIRNHHLGATFQDISSWITPQLEAALCPVLDTIDGYNYGRLDIRAPDFPSLINGRDLKILEANALYSEPVHAYDPKYGLWEAYRIFIGYWNTAMKTGIAHSLKMKQAQSKH